MHNETLLPPLESLPYVYRVVSVKAIPSHNGRAMDYRVELYHDKASMTVQFNLGQPDVRLKANLLVSIRWKLPVNSIGGAIQISRLVLIERPLNNLNLFETVPHTWVKDRDLVNRAKQVVEKLPIDLQHLLNSVLWDGLRFRLFCDRPASVGNHHAYQTGNLRHTVEVAETVLLLAGRYPQANVGISLAAALLHDVGKSAEYSPWSNGGWGMTDRGRLIGHRHTVIEWIAQAVATNRIMLPESHYLSLMHALTAAPNAEWLGIRNPATPEATLLSMADRLSGESALTAELAKDTGGWGNKHPHRKSKTFTLPADATPSQPLIEGN